MLIEVHVCSYTRFLFGRLFQSLAIGVNSQIVTCNRVVLLHGPPGTGKTSLCKALAQKLSIKLSDRYRSTHLVEINSHSLFSKWFSESGKLVQKMFNEIKRLMEDSRALICVLIDEVESLTAARKKAMSGRVSGRVLFCQGEL